MTTIHDDKGNPISEFPEVEEKKVMPTKVQNLLIDEKYDYVEVFYSNDGVTEVYTFKEDGANGTTVATLTLVYSDTTKEKLATATKT